MVEDAFDNKQLCMSAFQRLSSGEYPETVARDLRTQGVGEAELQALFADAAARQRRKGVIRIVAGVIVSLITLLVVVAAQEAGIGIYGPGVVIGLVILANGFRKVRNGGEIAKAILTR